MDLDEKSQPIEQIMQSIRLELVGPVPLQRFPRYPELSMRFGAAEARIRFAKSSSFLRCAKEIKY